MRLKVGDRIYARNYGSIVGVYTVNRVTNTQAVCENGKKFKIEYDDSIHTVERSKWNSTFYYIETPELIDMLFRQRAIGKLKSFQYEELTTTKLTEILKIIKTTKDGKE